MNGQLWASIDGIDVPPIKKGGSVIFPNEPNVNFSEARDENGFLFESSNLITTIKSSITLSIIT